VASFFGAAANNKCNLVSRSVQPPPNPGHMQGNSTTWHQSWSNHVATSCILIYPIGQTLLILRRWHVLAFSCWPGWLLSNTFSIESGMNNCTNHFRSIYYQDKLKITDNKLMGDMRW